MIEVKPSLEGSSGFYQALGQLAQLGLINAMGGHFGRISGALTNVEEWCVRSIFSVVNVCSLAQ